MPSIKARRLLRSPCATRRRSVMHRRSVTRLRRALVIGALLGRIYLQKKFGHQLYKKYIMVIFSGFIAGMGLIGMGSVAIALIAKSTSTLRY